VLTAKRHEQKDGADDEHLAHGEVAQQYHNDDEVERYSEKVHDCRSGLFGHIFPSHGTHSGPKDANTDFKDEEGRVDEELIGGKNDRYKKTERSDKEDGPHQGFDGEVVREEFEGGRTNHDAEHEPGEDDAMGNGLV
jgi:hypothetical protein